MLARRAQSPAKHSAMSPQFQYQQKVKPLLGYNNKYILSVSWMRSSKRTRHQMPLHSVGGGRTPLKISSHWIAELTQKSEGVLKQTCKLFVRMVMEKNRREKGGKGGKKWEGM